MLIPLSLFHTVQNMDLVRIDEALKANGYLTGADDLTSSRFLGPNTDWKFVYEVTFKHDSTIHKGNIYVEISFNKEKNTFEILADY
jgi:hypothetical protein